MKEILGIGILKWHAIAEQRKSAELHKAAVHNLKFGQIELAARWQREGARCSADAMRILDRLNSVK